MGIYYPDKGISVYIGIKEKTVNSNGNINEVWVECKDGFFRCPSSCLILTDEEILSDLKNKFIKKIY